MTIRRGRQPSLGLEMMNLFSKFDIPDPNSGTTVRDPIRKQAFHNEIGKALDLSLNNESRLHGWRVQGLFEAVIVGLGEIKMIKEEDVGGFYFDDRDGGLKLPDFRVIRKDGEHLLVEVKGVSPSGRLKPQRMREQDMAEQRRYAQLTNARLVFAHYWSVLNMWSLVDSSVFELKNDHYVLSLESAMYANELGLLGDASIGIEPPLVFSLVAGDGPQSERSVSPDKVEYGFTVKDVELNSAGHVLTDPLEKKIAWFLMQYGRWQPNQETVVVDGRLVRVNWTFEPELADDEQREIITRQGLVIVGPLSSMYSQLYNEATLTESGELRSVRHEANPGALSELIPTDYWDNEDRVLGLWKFIQEPTKNGQL